jgi:hypothetical protein
MVATSGSGWRLAPSLIWLFTEADQLFPGRSRASDGSIGDARHQAGASDHNPSGGFVLAGDLTHDPAHGIDAHAWADELRRRRDARISYVISAGRICSSYSNSARSAWEWGRYVADNLHFAHTHVSVLNTSVGRDVTGPWFAGGAPGPAAPTPKLQIPDRPYPGVVRLGDGMPPLPANPSVGAWQQALAERGAPLKVDGRFGESTFHVVRDWQTKHRLGPDGIAGPATWHSVLFG